MTLWLLGMIDLADFYHFPKFSEDEIPTEIESESDFGVGERSFIGYHLLCNNMPCRLQRAAQLGSTPIPPSKQWQGRVGGMSAPKKL